MIQVQNLYKSYVVHGKRSPVLENLNFTVSRGERLALIGRNGAGKSTLVRLLGKVETPTSGQVNHGMKVSWPLGLSGGFQGSLTGLDNIRFISRIYDVDFDYLFDFVDSFSELDKHLYKPVKTYSAGMKARLGFALSIAIDFDCYLIDEVILVGDQKFHQRCVEHLFNNPKNPALIIASHEMSLLASECTSALVIKEHQGFHYQNVEQAIENYLKTFN